MRAIGFALLLAVAAASIVTGVAMVCVPAAFITGGVLGAVWSALLFVEVRE